jgi:hypothetical protein
MILMIKDVLNRTFFSYHCRNKKCDDSFIKKNYATDFSDFKDARQINLS